MAQLAEPDSARWRGGWRRREQARRRFAAVRLVFVLSHPGLVSHRPLAATPGLLGTAPPERASAARH